MTVIRYAKCDNQLSETKTKFSYRAITNAGTADTTPNPETRLPGRGARRAAHRSAMPSRLEWFANDHNEVLAYAAIFFLRMPMNLFFSSMVWKRP